MARNFAPPTSRKVCRQHLATLLRTISDFQQVYDHQTKDFGGITPVAMVYSDGTRTMANWREEWHGYAIDILWRRSDDDTTEDYLDDLAQEVRDTLIQHSTATGKWVDLQPEEADFSALDYPMIDNVMYRRERIRVRVRPYFSGE